MFLITLFMMLAPGLISLRILWQKRDISRKDYKFLVCDYMIYSLLIHTVVYGFLFLTYPGRSVSFAADIDATSSILSASFIFKYSILSMLIAVVLPIFVPWVIKLWIRLEKRHASRTGKNDSK